MPRRDDIKSILVIGSGPIVIGQACEFDYSGTQACRVLREEGYRVILANSNPATIMTDPEFADATYVEPLDKDILTAIIKKEQPDAILPTLGGQTALNLAMELDAAGVLEQENVELIGANATAIRTAEIRDEFKRAMQEIGLAVPESGFAYTVAEALEIGDRIGYPVMVRPSFILGGQGTGIADNADALATLAQAGIEASPRGEILVERSIAGWKEYELEIMRDCADNCVIICSIENFDPMGVHTGDSITVAPAQTLSDDEYQRMRNAAIACIRRIGVDTGGSNVQFAVNPTNGDMVIIEMNPRVSRSSALASKATGFPIAKIAAKLAIGYRLDEINNDITGVTPASFEPTIDYVVTKVPRWAFEKFPESPNTLGSRMQSVGEVMAIGRTFCESLQKALRSLEQGRFGLNCDENEAQVDDMETGELLTALSSPTPERIFQVESALRRGVSIESVAARTGIDPWFLDQISLITEARAHFADAHPKHLSASEWKRLKRLGFSDVQLGYLWRDKINCTAPTEKVRLWRSTAGVHPTYKTVDTCGAEFAADTPYYYSTYEDEDEVRMSDRPKVIILGSGPNRIGQGVEFDYCCVHASFALRAAGFETIMINCNPETVSTDYDTSDRLYFEPLTHEDVLNVIEAEKRTGEVTGIVVSLGGQTPLKLASVLEPGLILGTSPKSIDDAEDRERWNQLCDALGIRQPSGGVATSFEEAVAIAEAVGYPLLVRPSYVLGGRAMRIVYSDDDLAVAMAELLRFGSLGKEGGLSVERPVLIDRFLEDAIEVDVDALRDADGAFVIGGIMEHVEEAGVHSGDSSCVLPPPSLSDAVVEEMSRNVQAIADALDVRGLINVQFAVADRNGENEVYVIEANPRASRTVPFVAKATGVPLAKVAARVQAGATLRELRAEGLLCDRSGEGVVSVKAPVMPFDRFPEADTLLLPEMRSTGEVMGIDTNVGMAFAKSQIAAYKRLPRDGTVFLSIADRDKPAALGVATRFLEMGFAIIATKGTAAYLSENGLQVAHVAGKIGVGAQESNAEDNAATLIADGKIQLVITTPRGGRTPRADGDYIRAAAQRHHIPCMTTVAAAKAATQGIAAWRSRALKVRTLQEIHAVRSVENGR